MFARRIVHTLCGVVLLGVLATSAHTQASDFNRTTHFTFSGVVRLPSVTLPAGTYTFQIANPGTTADVVLVTSRDRSKVYALQITRLAYRPKSRDLKPAITFGETPAGTPPTVKAWYPAGQTAGREFIY
jgi:hypothetical protein